MYKRGSGKLVFFTHKLQVVQVEKQKRLNTTNNDGTGLLRERTVVVCVQHSNKMNTVW